MKTNECWHVKLLVAVLVHMVPRLGLVLPLASDFPLNVGLVRISFIDPNVDHEIIYEISP